MWKRTAMRSFRILLIGGMVLFTAACGAFTLDEALNHPYGFQPTIPPWKSQTQSYYLDELPNLFFNETTFNKLIVVGISEQHGPCSGAAENDLSAARIIFEGLEFMHPEESLSFEDFCATDMEYFNCTQNDVVGHQDFEKLIIIGGPEVNLGWFYYNFHKSLAICFSRDGILVQPTGNVYRGSGYWGREGIMGTQGIGPSRSVTDYAIIELYNDEGRPVLLVAGLSGISTKIACVYLLETLVSGGTLPHKSGIVLRISWEAGRPLPSDYQIVEVVA